MRLDSGSREKEEDEWWEQGGRRGERRVEV